MKNFVPGFITLLIIGFACQKGIHWEFSSEGNIVKDADGNCMPVTISGTFKAHQPISDSNFLTIQIDVIAQALIPSIAIV